jgi:coenzyme F420-reducing hydrogenase alpha subunit
MTRVHVDVHHLTRVEGHGNIVVDVRNGVLEKCERQIVETPRFFEPMVRGRPYNEVSHIVSRICGICAVGHSTASLRAIETALGVEVTEQTRLLRRLNMHGETLDSHILHIYMLVAPDLLGLPSVMPLAKSQPEVVLRALRLKKLAGEICRVISGRHTHPIAMTVGGFTHLPTENDLLYLRTMLIDARADMDETVKLYAALQMPAFERETEYIASHKDDEYCFIDGVIANSDGGRWPVSKYRSITNEYLVPHSSAKRTRHERESYMVGALARFNVNYAQLHPRAKAAAQMLGMQPIVTNPYMNTVAQVVECVHCIEDALELVETLLTRGIRWETPVAPPHDSGTGAGVCDVPRGILFHEYTIEAGRVTAANCIIPTGQNLQNAELDMRALVPQILDRPQSAITLALEMLIRAYDPCISCSTHILNVEFK